MVERNGIFGDQENEFVKCRCGSFEHVVEASSYIEYRSQDSSDVVDCEVFLTFHEEDLTFFQRLKRLFQRRPHVQEVILNRKDVKKLHKFLEEFLEATNSLEFNVAREIKEQRGK